MDDYFLVDWERFVREKPNTSLYRHKDDIEFHGENWRTERECAPCPAVYPLGPNADHKVILTEQWQYFIRAINWGMTLTNIWGLFGARKAFTNREDDPRRNWLLRRDLNMPDPDQDRVRSCARAPILVRSIIDDFALIDMMDGSKPPPLKEGFSYPSRVGEINPNAYLYHPRTHPGKFLVATNTNLKGQTRPFPNGAVYNWTGDGQPYVFWPYVSRRPIIYPVEYLVKIDKFETPYT